MSWRLDLADRPVLAARLIRGELRAVAVWLAPNEVCFLDADRGDSLGDLLLEPPLPPEDPTGPRWQTYAETLRAPNGGWLYPVTSRGVLMLGSHDGRQRVTVVDGGYRLLLELDGHQTSIAPSGSGPICAAGLDRELGTMAVLSCDGSLDLYQQHMLMGRAQLAAQSLGTHPQILIADFAQVVVVVGYASLDVVDLSGRRIARHDSPSAIGLAACSPDGAWITVSDQHTALLRVYDRDLVPVRQGSAHAVWQAARALQLLERIPAADAMISGLDMDRDGALLFALGGSVCCAQIEDLPSLPRRRMLF